MHLRWAILASLALGLVAITAVAGPRAGADVPSSPPLVERVRTHVLADGRIAEERLLIDPALGDPDELGDDPEASTPGTVSAQFVLWHRWDNTALPVPVSYNPAGEPAGVDGATALEIDMSIWNAVPGQNFQFGWAGPTAATYGVCDDSKVGDGVNSVGWGAPSSDKILASTCGLEDRGTFALPGQSTLHRTYEFDMLINPNAKWSTAKTTPPGMYDLYSTVLHELGHALGLNHSNAPGAVMSPTLAAGKMVRTPTDDDIAGIRALYGDGSPQLPPATPPPLPDMPYALQFAAMSRDN